VLISDLALSRCDKTQPQKFVNEMLTCVYSEEFMVCHSLGGTSSKESVKTGLPADDVAQITGWCAFVLLVCLLAIICFHYNCSNNEQFICLVFCL